MSMLLLRSGFELLRGTPRVFAKTFEDDGRQKFNYFCGDCGVRVWTDFSRHPQVVNLKPGTLDDASWLAPVAHLWRRSAQRWLPVPEGVLCFEQQPPDFTPVLEAWAVRTAR
jgi:hypothetical protein